MTAPTPKQMRALADARDGHAASAWGSKGYYEMHGQVGHAQMWNEVVDRYTEDAAVLRAAADQLEAVRQWCKDNGAPAAYPVAPFSFDKGVTAAATDVLTILTAETTPSEQP